VNCAADVILPCQDLREFPGAIGIGYDFVDAALMWHEFPPVANSVEVDDLISQLTRGKHSIYTPSI
jgi:hypothetical protein